MPEPAEEPRRSLLSEEAVVALMWDSEWRARMIRRVDVDRARVYRETLSLQSAPLIGPLESYSSERLAEEVEIFLPVDTLPKRPLVNFSLDGPGDQGFLLKRRHIAEIENEFIYSVADEVAGVRMSPLAARYCTAICEFTPAPYVAIARKFRGANQRPAALRKYLSENLPVALSDEEFTDFLRRADKVGCTLRRHLAEPTDYQSSADSPLLALPLAVDGLSDVDHDTLEQLFGALEDFVYRCDVATTFEEIDPLSLLAAYGRRWELVVQFKVPMYEPFVVHASRDVYADIERWGWIELPFRFNDAASNHVSVRLLDADVKFHAMKPIDLWGKQIPRENFVTLEKSREDISAYGSDDERLIDLRLRAQLTTAGASSIAYWTFLLVLLGVVALLFVIKPLTSDAIAVLVVPTTFASAFLLAQPRTSITARLQSVVRRLTAFSLLTMWIVVGILYIIQWAEP